MGCIFSAESQADLELAIYGRNFKQSFSPESYAGYFISICSAPKNNSSIVDNNNSQISSRIRREVSASNVLQSQDMLFNSSEQPCVLQNLVCEPLDQADELVQSIVQEDSSSSSEEIIIVKRKHRHRRIIKVNKFIKRHSISFYEMLQVVQNDVNYITEYDLFQIYYYVKTQFVQPVSFQKEYVRQKMDGDLNEYTIDLKLFLGILYLCQPPQMKRVLTDQLYIIYFMVDYQFNQMIRSTDYINTLIDHFPQLKAKLEKYLTKIPVVITKNEFELQTSTTIHSFVQADFMLEFTFTKKQLKHHFSKQRKFIKSLRVNIGEIPDNIYKSTCKQRPRRSQDEIFMTDQIDQMLDWNDDESEEKAK
ncbi:Conserved_hypothetical protein [Hexamita inflata]|uniref:Uncharacterized protein n=1 Tax=Hexamita inflata TaxID=28002 RepID=A0AA86VHB9_9EUKA|nr:Conserved hypothetical protein [Hexamita inflata]CAI9966673.1 Conserved hypothetical protein [Hexamita inflata]